LAFVTRRNLPLGPALQTLAQAGPVAFRWQLKKLFSHVEAGQPVASAMARFPRLFPPAYVSMVRAGETNGNLAAVFQRLQTYDEAVIRFQRRLALTIMYPLTVFGILVVLLTLMTVCLLPRFQTLFVEMNVEPPSSTLALFQMLPHVKDVSLALGLIALVVIGLASLRHRARWARRTLQVPLAAFPGYARCVRDIAVARFCHTLSALLDAGTPMVGALEAAASVRTGVRIEKHLARLSQGVAEGRSLSAQMAASGGFPSTFQWMVSVGEQSGDLPRALARLADMYEASAGRMLTYMTRALFPMLIVALGVAEAVFVFAMFLPLVKLAGGIGPG
ncbi:MAG: type II secretion system F family protein, partial [Planctomycetes bacterium]|nr:type II secretion system F family protein [Planctomycetota bacterium]